jgi:hypothetical protein
VDWSLVISALALALSIALGIREFAARAIPFGFVEEMYIRREGEWETIAHRVHVMNIGRRPFVLQGAGVLNPDGDGIHGSQGVGWVDADGHEVFRTNPECPKTIQPGELTTFFVAPKHRDTEDPLGALIVYRNPWRWLPGQKRTRRRQVRLESTH